MNDENGFTILWDELKRRVSAPVRHVTFWVYLILGVIVFGGFPVWLEFISYITASVNESASLRTALIAFFPALIGSVSFQLIFEEVERRNKRMMAFAMFVVVFFSLMGGVLILVQSIPNYFAIPIASVSCAFAVLEWWIANGFNPTFQDALDVEAPVGGSPSQRPSGDLTGFRT